MSTYDKLGQYSATELPIAPSNVVIRVKVATTIALSWTNNNGVEGSNIIGQLWMGNHWLTKNTFDATATSGTITELPNGEDWRLRVAVLKDGVIYPAAPVIVQNSEIYHPDNLYIVGNFNGWNITNAVQFNKNSATEFFVSGINGDSSKFAIYDARNWGGFKFKSSYFSNVSGGIDRDEIDFRFTTTDVYEILVDLSTLSVTGNH